MRIKVNLLKIKSLLPMASLLLILASNIFSQTVTTPRPVSPAAELKQTIGLSQVTVNYSRPRLTLNGVDRTGKIWGVQVPFGLTNLGFGTATKAPWRAGANENTVITFSDDVAAEDHLPFDEALEVVFGEPILAQLCELRDQHETATGIDRCSKADFVHAAEAEVIAAQNFVLASEKARELRGTLAQHNAGHQRVFGHVAANPKFIVCDILVANDQPRLRVDMHHGGELFHLVALRVDLANFFEIKHRLFKIKLRVIAQWLRHERETF